MQMSKEFNTKKRNIVRIDNEGLEQTTFILKPDVSPIYEYENGVKTEKIKGNKVGVLGIDGPYAGMDLILRTRKAIKVDDSFITVQIKVDMDETSVYTINGKPGIQFSLWVSDITRVNLKGA